MPSSPFPPTFSLILLLILSTPTNAATPTLPTEILPQSTIYPSLLGPSHNTLTTYPTTYPTIPATVFSTNYFASILHITGCPTAILPSTTSFIDVNGQVTSFLTLGCGGAQVTQSCQTGASTFGGASSNSALFCCPGAGWTGTEFATNAIMTATTSGGAWCFSSFTAMSPTTTSTATLPSTSDTYTRDPTSILYPPSSDTTGPRPTAYPTALSNLNTQTTTQAPTSASSAWGNPALTVIVTAASYKNKKRQAIGTPVMAESAVVLNDLVFVRAATVGSSAVSSSSMTSATMTSGGGGGILTASGMASSVSVSRATTGISTVSTTSVGTVSLSTAAIASSSTTMSAVASVRPNGGGRLVVGTNASIMLFFCSLMMMMMLLKMMIIGVL